MKDSKIFLLLAGLILIFLTKNCLSQSNYMQKLFIGSENERIEALCSTYDGGYILGGTTDGFSYSWETTYIIKMNSAGDVEWSKQYADIWDSRCHKIIQTSDSSFIYLMNSNTAGSPFVGTCFIMKTDKNGNQIWTKTFDNGIVKDVLETADNGFLVFGTTEDFGGVDGDFYLVKIDENGNPLWSKTYDGGDNEQGWSIVEDDNGGYLLCGRRGDVNGNSGIGQAVVICVSSTGSLIWSNSYSLSGIDRTEGNKIIKANDGGFIVGGENTKSLSGNICLFKIDNTGNSSWATSYSISGFGDIESYGSDQYYLSGGNFDLFLLKLDNNSDTSLVMSYGDYGDQWSAKIEVSENGYFAMSGYSNQGFDQDNGDAYFIKGSDLGNSGCYFYNSSLDVISENILTNTLTISVGSGLNFSSTTLLESGINLQDTVLCSYCGFPEDICIVTVDSSSTKNIVSWEKDITGNIDSYNVYRDILGSYTLIGNVPYDSLSAFIDTTNGIDPNITSYRYKIASLDTCGIENSQSEFHETMHLTTSLGTNNDINLIWDSYEGIPITYYRIFRDTIGLGNFHLLDSVASTNFTFTDNDPALDKINTYFIEIIPEFPCSSTKAANYSQSRSNRPHTLGPPAPMHAQCFASSNTIFEGDSINFFDITNADPTEWFWSFQGASPDTSNLQDPINIRYPNIGQFNVKLIARNTSDSSSIFLPGYINVIANNGQIPIADFIATATVVNVGDPIDFYDLSTNIPTNWNWDFPGSDQLSSTFKNPTNITYSNPGIYNVTLSSSNFNGSNSISKTNYITVLSSTNIEEIDLQGNLEIFPNPSEGSLTIKSNFNETIEIYIYNQLGQITFQERLDALETKHINLSHSGIYSVQVSNSHSSKFYKIIVK